MMHSLEYPAEYHIGHEPYLNEDYLVSIEPTIYRIYGFYIKAIALIS